jgi:hypothetical protein
VIVVPKNRIDINKWKPFKLEDLFEIKISQSVDKIKLIFEECGEYEYIGRTSINNGVQGFLNKLKFDANPSETFSVTQIGEKLCQYRDKKWYSCQNIFILTPIDRNILRVPLFFTTVITQMLKTIYGDSTYNSYPTMKTLPLNTIT